MNPAVDDFRARAQRATEAGQEAEAAAVFGEAVAAHPDDAALWNSAANASLRAGSFEEAVARYASARQLAPDSLEFAVNHAIALGRLGRHRAAIAALAAVEGRGASDVRYCSVRANACRNAGDLAEAARWYDRALAADPAHARAAHGRARTALERGEPDAVAWFDAALSNSPGDPELWLGKAQALEVAGQVDDALTIAQALAERIPQWVEATRFLSQLLLAAGNADFSAPYRAAAQRAPDDPGIPAAHCAVLAGLDRAAEAAEVAADARRRFPRNAHFALLEATHAGEAGQDERADAIWADLPVQTAERALHEARHRLRIAQPEVARSLIDRVLEEDPDNVAGWALRGLVWRLLDDPRKAWLHEQAGLVRFLPLHSGDGILPRAMPALNALHDGSAFPLGQSLRGGTQTRGGLFDRCEPVWADLHTAVAQTLETYRAGLAPHDPRHPLLRHRDSAWRIAGSWSVRLSGGGDHHTSHIHPQGIVSSALYLALPDVSDTSHESGWLEIGRPPPDLRLDLPPLHSIRPEEGHLALFPSTLYHGTRPFPAGRRLTVAFDVQPAEPDGP